MQRRRTTITLYKVPSPDMDTRKKFRCLECNHTAFQYYGEIKRWLAGDFHEELYFPEVILCNERYCIRPGINLTCKYLYVVGFDANLIDSANVTPVY